MAATRRPVPAFEALLRKIEAADAALDAAIARDAQRDAKQDADRAEAARDGELGADWRAVQQRIDRGQTTLQDVFSGADESGPAEALREQSQRRMQAMREEWEEQDEDATQTEPSPAAKVTGAAAAAERHRAEVLRGVMQNLQR